MTPGDADRERMIQEYRYLCKRGANKFLRDGVDRSDLEQVAAIGLIKATDRFNPAIGTPFEAYAWRLVLGELMHYVRDSERILRGPRRVRELQRRYAAAERELCAQLGREPSVAEIVQILGISREDVEEMLQYRQSGVAASIDALYPYEYVALSYTIDQQLERMSIEAALATLSAVEREIVKEIYENDTPVNVIAERLGYTRRHISRLHHGALEKLRAQTRPKSA